MDSVPDPPTVILGPDGPFPQALGRYRLLARLGAGGMGTVFRAHDEVLDIEVALKVPHAELMQQQAHRDRFLQEARAAVRLNHHPNFCKVLDVGVHGTTHYLAMDFVPGRPLTPTPRRSPHAVAELVHTLAAALAEAHRLGIVHRDIKPSNILLTPEGRPVITDFGLALRLHSADPRLTRPGTVQGTPWYMAPEQIDPSWAALGPACDVYSLGVIFYELLTGELPFNDDDAWALMQKVLNDPPPLPSRKAAGLDPVLESICLKTLAKRPDERFAGMDQLAAALAECLGGSATRIEPSTPPSLLVPREAVRFVFVGYGERAPAQTAGRDRLFLDVGNALKPGVLDHHHQTVLSGSTASLVLARPELVAGAVNPRRRPDDPFTIVLHEQPDLDGIAASYLAIARLTEGAFPPEAAALARYVDRVDDGTIALSPAQPFSLYAAYKCLVHRLLGRAWRSNQERWQETVRQGLQVVEHVLAEVGRQGVPLPAVDALAAPGVFDPSDRDLVTGDVERYRAKLADPACAARRARLRLPGLFGGTVEAEALLVRDVSNVDDKDRCIFFKDWARSDPTSPRGKGYAALSVFMSEGPGHVRRCILSTTPGAGVTLRGLGALLDEAEAKRRKEIFGVDDRVVDPSTGDARLPRPGYDNADPWYDGRAQGHTIVDAPRGGTLLTADEIEALFLAFGGSGGAA